MIASILLVLLCLRAEPAGIGIFILILIWYLYGDN
jgi:hypothetical protein